MAAGVGLSTTRPLGCIVVSVLQLLWVVIATIAILGEVLLDIGEVYRIGLRKKGEGCCRFISTLKHMPPRQRLPRKE